MNCTNDAQQEEVLTCKQNSVAASHFCETFGGHCAKKIDDFTSEKILIFLLLC
jgi:hypothetical protein